MVISALSTTVLAAAAARLLYTRLEVAGLSMVPEYAPGDRVVVRKTHQVAVGDVVAVRDPGDPDRYLIKRVVALERHAVRVEGDNSGASTDSRHFGPVPDSLIVGRVVAKYRSAGGRGHPAHQAASQSSVPRAQ